MGVKLAFALVFAPSVKWSSGRIKHIDMYRNQKDPRGPGEREMGRGTAKGCMESQHIHFQSNKFHDFEVVTLYEIKFRSTRTKPEAMYCPHRLNPRT
jgi:hypothetical protein